MKLWKTECISAGETVYGRKRESLFAAQTHTAATVDNESGKVYGLYILHPNNVGRCGHICNASFGGFGENRGLHIGEMLVSDCLAQAKKSGFQVLQFNAVVASNVHARHLYESSASCRSALYQEVPHEGWPL